MRSFHPSMHGGTRWRRLRMSVLKAAGWRCASCGEYGNEVDHVRPIQHGGDPWDRDNLQCLCRGCHIAKTAGELRRPPTPEEAEWEAFARGGGPLSGTPLGNREPGPGFTQFSVGMTGMSCREP